MRLTVFLLVMLLSGTAQAADLESVGTAKAEAQAAKAAADAERIAKEKEAQAAAAAEAERAAKAEAERAAAVAAEAERAKKEQAERQAAEAERARREAAERDAKEAAEREAKAKAEREATTKAAAQPQIATVAAGNAGGAGGGDAIRCGLPVQIQNQDAANAIAERAKADAAANAQAPAQLTLTAQESVTALADSYSLDRKIVSRAYFAALCKELATIGGTPISLKSLITYLADVLGLSYAEISAEDPPADAAREQGQQAAADAERAAKVEAERAAMAETERAARVEAERAIEAEAARVAQAQADLVLKAEAERAAAAEAAAREQAARQQARQAADAERTARVDADRAAAETKSAVTDDAARRTAAELPAAPLAQKSGGGGAAPAAPKPDASVPQAPPPAPAPPSAPTPPAAGGNTAADNPAEQKPKVSPPNGLLSSNKPAGTLGEEECRMLGVLSNCTDLNAVLDHLLEKPVEYNHPNKMMLGRKTEIALVLRTDWEGKDLPDKVSEEFKGLPGEVKQGLSKITQIMSAELTGRDFEISPSGRQERTIVPPQPVTWNWQVTPNDTGSAKILKLRLYAHVQGPQGAMPPILVKTLDATIDVDVTAWDWVMNQARMLEPVYAILAALIGLLTAFFTFVLARRRRSAPGDGGGGNFPFEKWIARRRGPVIGDLSQSTSDGRTPTEDAEKDERPDDTAAGKDQDGGPKTN